MKIGEKTTVALLLVANLVLVNYLASSYPAKIDLTAQKIYTLSAGTRNLISKIEEPVAKATYISKTNRWKIYWMRADLKWHAYPPHPEAVFFDEGITAHAGGGVDCFLRGHESATAVFVVNQPVITTHHFVIFQPAFGKG